MVMVIDWISQKIQNQTCLYHQNQLGKYNECCRTGRTYPYLLLFIYCVLFFCSTENHKKHGTFLPYPDSKFILRKKIDFYTCQPISVNFRKLRPGKTLQESPILAGKARRAICATYFMQLGFSFDCCHGHTVPKFEKSLAQEKLEHFSKNL